MEDDNCSICGEILNDQFSYKLKCGHEFHYKCLLLSFKNVVPHNNTCPYCRSSGNLLPLVNGIKKIYPEIHDISNLNNFKTHTCNMVLQRGKNKGLKCSKKCALGYDFCKVHLKNNKNKNENNIKKKT